MAIPLVRTAYHRIQLKQVNPLLNQAEVRKQVACALRELPHNTAADTVTISLFYEKLATLIRDYAGTLREVRGGALTSSELEQALLEAGTESREAKRLSEIVAFADRVRYAEDGIEQGRTSLPDIREETIRLLEAQ
jgi:hypothetical protein